MALYVGLQETYDWLINERAKYSQLANREYWILDSAAYSVAKNIPRKCEYGKGYYPCPNCDESTAEDNGRCSSCGQAIIH